MDADHPFVQPPKKNLADLVGFLWWPIKASAIPVVIVSTTGKVTKLGDLPG